MRHFLVMLVLSGSLCAAFLFLAACHSAVPLAKPVYGSSSDAVAVDRALPAPAVVVRSNPARHAAPVVRAAPAAPKASATPVRPVRRVVPKRTPVPILPSFVPKTDCCGPFG